MARKRFGQLSKERKAKIRARPEYQGLTKKQVRQQFNARLDSNRDKLSASNNTRPAAATTTQSQLQAAGADETDLRSGKITGVTTGTEYDLSNKSDLGSMKEFDPKTYNKAFGTNQSPETLPGGNPENTLPGGNPENTLPGGILDDTLPGGILDDIFPYLPTFLKNNATYLSGASAGGIRRRRSRRSKLGINAMGTNQLKRNFRNMMSIGGINI